jgi:hypothetical protein
LKKSGSPAKNRSLDGRKISELDKNSLRFLTGNYFEQTGNSERENARNRECGAISFMLHEVAICFAAI